MAEGESGSVGGRRGRAGPGRDRRGLLGLDKQGRGTGAAVLVLVVAGVFGLRVGFPPGAIVGGAVVGDGVVFGAGLWVLRSRQLVTLPYVIVNKLTSSFLSTGGLTVCKLEMGMGSMGK